MDTKQRLINAALVITKENEQTYTIQSTDKTAGRDNFGFYIEHDLGGPDSKLVFKSIDTSTVQVSFDNDGELSTGDKEVIDALNSLSEASGEKTK